MAAGKITRKLTTILAADAANYSGRMAQDEVGTVQALRRARTTIDQIISDKGGRIANTSGDGLIAEFPSVIDGLDAAVDIQRALSEDPEGLPFRIGMHLGDVIENDGDLLGDGVNLAARLQDMAREGGILATRQIADHVSGRTLAQLVPIGPVRPKNMDQDIDVFAVTADGVAPAVRLSDVTPRSTWNSGFDPRDRSQLPDRIQKYVKTRKRSVYMIGGFVVLDIITGAGFGWSLWPAAAIGAIWGMARFRLSGEERSMVPALRSGHR